jgi:hypothetical protein
MNILVNPETSMTPVERAEALLAGIFSNIKSLETFMKSYPLVDFRDLERDLMNAQDRIMNLAVKADKFKRQEELDEMLARDGLT